MMLAGNRAAALFIGLLTLCIIMAAPAAGASDQVTVKITNNADLTVSAGQSVSDGGDCTITNQSSVDTVTITSMTYTLSSPGLFSSTTLTLNGNSQTAPSPASSNSATFDVSIAPGDSVECSFSAEISSKPGNNSLAAGTVSPRSAYASMGAAAGHRRIAGFVILAAGVLLFKGDGSRGHPAVLLLALALAATQIGCGNGSSDTSTQVITAVAADSGAGTTVSGLPGTIGTLTLSGTSSGS